MTIESSLLLSGNNIPSSSTPATTCTPPNRIRLHRRRASQPTFSFAHSSATITNKDNPSIPFGNFYPTAVEALEATTSSNNSTSTSNSVYNSNSSDDYTSGEDSEDDSDDDLDNWDRVRNGAGLEYVSRVYIERETDCQVGGGGLKEVGQEPNRVSTCSPSSKSMVYHLFYIRLGYTHECLNCSVELPLCLSFDKETS